MYNQRHFYFQSCSENYAGETAASEAETQAIQNLLAKYQTQIKLYLSLQGFGQKILIPYNYGPEAPRIGPLRNWALRAAVRIYRFNRTWYPVAVGGKTSPEFGTSSDYAFGKSKVPAAYTVKLPRGGETGYEVPENKLDSILTESFEGLLEFIRLPRN